MKQSRQQKIGAEGENLFPTLLPEGWIAQKLNPDYGEDFRVRLTNYEDVSPKTITVQIKTVSKLELRGRDAKIAIEQKDLLFWSNVDYSDTMFLVVIDLENRKGYWLYMRKYLTEGNKGWKKKKKPTIYIPLQNDLSDEDTFVQAVNESITHNSIATSVSAKNQIDQHFAYLRQIDPRFDFTYLQDHTGTMIEIRAKEQIDVKMTVMTKGKQKAIQKATDVFKRGRAVQFAPGELRITGSPLFDKFYADGCTIQIARKSSLPVTVKVIKIDSVLASLDMLPGEMESAADEMRYKTAMPESPLQWSCTYARETGFATFNLHHEFKLWHGKRISQCRLFHPIIKFLKALQGGDHIDFQYHAAGSSISFGAIDIADTNFGKPNRLVDNYSIIRDVAEYYRIDPIIELREMPDVYDAKILHGLMNGGAYSRVVDDRCHMRGNIEASDVHGLLTAMGNDTIDITVRNSVVFDVLGEKIALEDIVSRIDKTAVVNKRNIIKQSKKGGAVAIHLRSKRGAKFYCMNAVDCPDLPDEPRRYISMKANSISSLDKPLILPTVTRTGRLG